MVAYAAVDVGHTAAHWCTDCGALRWVTYRQGEPQPAAWRLPGGRRGL